MFLKVCVCMYQIPLESLGSRNRTQTRRKVLQPLSHLLSLHNTFKGKKLLYFAASELFFLLVDFFFFFELGEGFCYIFQAGLEFAIILPEPYVPPVS